MSPGDVIEINVNHPAVGSTVLYPKSQEDATYDYGGIRTTDDEANVDGGGRAINPKYRKRWIFETTITWDMTGQDELDIAKKIASAPEDAEFTFTHVNGDVRRGKGTIVGTPQGNAQAGTISIKMSGGGTLEKIA